MLVLALVGLVAGVITSLSPCVLPVLPVVLTASVPSHTGVGSHSDVDDARDRVRSWRPYGVVAGLVLSFSVATLFGSLLLSALHLPADLLRMVGIVVLVVIGVSFVWRHFGELLERPFARLSGRQVNPDSNGLILGMGLGLLYVPCAGSVLAVISVVGASHQFSAGALVLTAAFGVGVGLPLLMLGLVDCGKAPEPSGIVGSFNTPGDAPLTLASLRGKVVLIDFWTYSCINCQRTLPHLEAWDRAYRDAGLVIVGVHTPEFAFEHVPSNVRQQAHALGVEYPVAIDNDFATWREYNAEQ